MALRREVVPSAASLPAGRPQTGPAPRLPTAVLRIGMVLPAFFPLIFGLLPDSVQRDKSAMPHFVHVRRNGVRSYGHGA